MNNPQQPDQAFRMFVGEALLLLRDARIMIEKRADENAVEWRERHDRLIEQFFKLVPPTDSPLNE